ncbi:hypothetical protein GUITHDRAFT_104845 [Guillardia theta CCMP2712]|uniref:Uncharacterized protein n=2 Tax=Guillardia theta TaxID=55529 RepID=L1JLT7_GUITC|nr:hypothetical protein GUITHDRAFT_104845 [Guillardia theta CCMP2712]EKX49317.1 hypothetical protein GUITHDRAFT_104845 [Guillardia theta CCMP2712]|eukprot:XP_005836297.1 hypothetical protein GUITHDRAFT_104845 [Guillardia theta CCMP2712]
MLAYLHESFLTGWVLTSCCQSDGEAKVHDKEVGRACSRHVNAVWNALSAGGSSAFTEMSKRCDLAIQTLFRPEDPVLDHYIRKTHEDLKHGIRDAQVMIDRSLISCWIAKKFPDLYNRIPNDARLLHPSITYHHSTLPDIGRFISQSLIQKDWKSNLILNVICNSIPCLKRNRVAFLAEELFVDPSTPVLVNIMHGLLLGLYPNTAKRPSFEQRVRCASELRSMMTRPLQEQARFIYSNLNLLKLSIMEYVWYACNTFIVSEKEIICSVQGMQTFFDICPNVADAFRQETLQSGDWTWDRLDEVATVCVDRCVRTCKFRSGRHAPSKEVVVKWRRITDDMDHLFDAAKSMNPVNINGLLWKIYHRDNPNITVEEFNIIDHLHSRCKVYPLPCNLTAMQCSAILKRYSSDHFQMENMMKVHICMKCCNKLNGFTVSSKLRLCMQTNQLRCASCGLHNSIISVNMLGKILVIQGASYILCPCCGTFKRWNHTGNEFTKPCEFANHYSNPRIGTSLSSILKMSSSDHGGYYNDIKNRKSSKSSYFKFEASDTNSTLIKNGRACCKECIRCGKTSNLERVVVLNAKYGVHIQLYLCMKHMLPRYIMKFVIDIKDLARACVNYDRSRESRRRCGKKRRIMTTG